MEKVMRTTLALCLILGFILFSCGEKKQERTIDQIQDKLAIDSIDTVVNQEPAYAAEIFEYRSESLKNYQLYAIYLFQDAPQFLVVRNDKPRLLVLNENKEVEEGQALDDEDFSAVKFLQEAESNGVTTFGQIELTNKAGVNFSFNHSQTKRVLKIESQYSHVAEDISGKLGFEQAGEVYTFSMITDDGEQCELKGTVRIKGNVGYYQAQPNGVTCKLIFFFAEKGVWIFTVPSTCGCGKQASMNTRYFWK